jgi:acetyl-CoA C-acetyltransferase
VPRDRWVFPLAGAAADDPLVSERTDLARSPAIGAAGRRALTLAGIGVDEVAHVDVYSCFPAAVQLAAGELGLRVDDDRRPLTVTGGLAFAGGPWSNYVSHAIATMTGRLRSNPGTLGLVTGLGGFATKHAVALYGTEPPAHPFRWEKVAPDPSTPRPVADRYQGPAQLEAWTVMFDPGGAPETGIATCITPAGHRAWATTTAPADMRTMATKDLAGAGVELTDGQLRL